MVFFISRIHCRKYIHDGEIRNDKQSSVVFGSPTETLCSAWSELPRPECSQEHLQLHSLSTLGKEWVYVSSQTFLLRTGQCCIKWEPTLFNVIDDTNDCEYIMFSHTHVKHCLCPVGFREAFIFSSKQCSTRRYPAHSFRQRSNVIISSTWGIYLMCSKYVLMWYYM